MATNYNFIKKVLDNFMSIKPELTTIDPVNFVLDPKLPDSDGGYAAERTKLFTTVKHIIANLYVVFHFPEKLDTAIPTVDTEFDLNVSNKPKILESDRILNYIFTSTNLPGGGGSPVKHKILLSNTGINKETFINLKMILDELNKFHDKEANFLDFLYKVTTPPDLEAKFDSLAVTLTRGGGKTGGMTKSNKKLKKLKKKNKSSKSQR